MRTTTLLLALVAMFLAMTQATPVAIENAQTVELEKRSKSKSKSKSATVTWYSGSSLDNPACGGSTPSSSEHVAAIVPGKGYAKCGDHIKLSHNGKSVTVKVVDYCGSCSGTWFDITTSAFKELASLDTGEIKASWEKA